MLSSITPLGEAGRGRPWGPTAAWFAVGAVAGGACLGALTALAALAVAAAGTSATVAAGVGSGVCAAALLVEVGAAGPRLPVLRRQVNEVWLDRFRPWVYGGGFGWQIGFGFATYVMTAAVGAMVALAALSGSAVGAVEVGAAFGAARGATVLVGAGVHMPGDLQRVQRVLDRLQRPVRLAAVAVLAAAAAGLAVRAGGWAGAAGEWLPVGAAAAAAATAAVVGARVAEAARAARGGALASGRP